MHGSFLGPVLAAALLASASAAAADVSNLVNRINADGIAAYQRTAEPGQNHLLSPPGPALIVDFITLAAGGATRDELVAAGSPAAADPAWPELRAHLVSQARSNRVTLRSQAILAHTAGCTVDRGIADVAQQTFNLEVLTDRALLAGWPARMQRLFDNANAWPPPAFASDTAALALHLIHFHGRWAHPFPLSASRDRPFWVTPEHHEQVGMMSVDETFEYVRAPWGRLAVLPYTGDAFRMLLLLPAPGQSLAGVESAIATGALARALAVAKRTSLRVSLPRFAFTAETDLRPVLEARGIRRAWSGGEADFTPLIRCTAPVYLRQVRQAAMISVDEEGTTASAITDAEFMEMGEPPRPLDFTCDHPFLFVIQARDTGLILFLGRFVRP